MMMKKGNVISETVLYERIHRAVQEENPVKLHNQLCKGKVAVYVSEGGEPLKKNGEVAGENDEWVYLCTESEE